MVETNLDEIEAVPALESPPRPRGRPAKGAEVEVTAEIVAAARSLFFERGYERTSIDDVAEQASCSKRTLYNRFPTKNDLFEAVIVDFAGKRRFAADAYVVTGKTLAEKLHLLARWMVQAFLDPEVLALYFLIHGEARRFPELVRIADAAGKRPSREKLKALLQENGLEDTEFLADQFHTLIKGPILQSVLAGHPEGTEILFDRAGKSVEFFLRGCQASEA